MFPKGPITFQTYLGVLVFSYAGVSIWLIVSLLMNVISVLNFLSFYSFNCFIKEDYLGYLSWVALACFNRVPKGS